MNPMELFSSLESRYKLPQGYLDRVYQVESSGGKNLYNEKSGATGPFQFIPSTARAMGLQNANDLTQSAEAAARLAAQNRDYLQKKGVEVDGRVLYLAHNQGADGAYQLLTNADKPATEVVRKEAVTWNSGKEGQPAGEFATTIMSKYGESEGGAYSALGTSEPVGEKESVSSAAEDRRSSRKESFALNTLMNASKQLEQKAAPMLAIPRLSYAKGGIVSLVDAAEEVRAAGRKNDTVLAHITPAEAEFLKRLGGAGSTNPKTGLLEFDDSGGGGGDGGDGGNGSGSDAGSGNDAGTGTGSENGNDAGAGLGGGGSDAGTGNGSENGTENGAAAAAASETEAEPEVEVKAEPEAEPETKVDPEVKAELDLLIENLDLLSNNPFANVRTDFVAPSPTLEQFFAPPADPAPVAAPTQALEDILGNTRSGQFGISGVVGSPDPQEAMGMNNLGTFGLNGPVSTQTYDEMLSDFKALSDAKGPTAPATQDQSFAERAAALPSPVAWELPVIQEKTAEQRMSEFRPDLVAAFRSNAPAAAPAQNAPTVAANPEFWNTIASPVFNAPQFAAPTVAASAPAAAITAPSAPNAVAPIASSTTYTNTPSFLNDPLGWAAAKASNVANNPAEYAVNAMMMGVPVVGTLNTMSGFMGGPTIGGIMQAGTPAGPEDKGNDLGGDGSSPPKGSQVATAYPTTSGRSTVTPTLDWTSLYDLNNFLSKKV